jgi:hypothetical protein
MNSSDQMWEIPLEETVQKKDNESSFFMNESKFFNLDQKIKKIHYEKINNSLNTIRCPLCGILLSHWNKMSHLGKCLTVYESCFNSPVDESKDENINNDEYKKNSKCFIKIHNSKPESSRSKYMLNLLFKNYKSITICSFRHLINVTEKEFIDKGFQNLGPKDVFNKDINVS